jgi:hypothetical protein
LGSLEDLPAADELRRIPIQKPETLLTADHQGLATAPPEGISVEPQEPVSPHTDATASFTNPTRQQSINPPSPSPA